MVELPALLADLRGEGEDLAALVTGLDPNGWRTPTPAPGWSVAHQIAHLAWTDEISLISVTDPERFAAELGRAAADPIGYVEAGAAEGMRTEPAALLRRWQTGREALAGALATAEGKLPWYGPPMSPASMATARLMETWAHGQDVADALGVRRTPTARLRHIAHLGVRTRAFAFALREKTPPADVRVELAGPDGDRWTWGAEDAADRLTGPALDFCLLVTQRRHPADLALAAEGAGAGQWLSIAQAFAGPPGGGRAPGASA